MDKPESMNRHSTGTWWEVWIGIDGGLGVVKIEQLAGMPPEERRKRYASREEADAALSEYETSGGKPRMW